MKKKPMPPQSNGGKTKAKIGGGSIYFIACLIANVCNPKTK